MKKLLLILLIFPLLTGECHASGLAGDFGAGEAETMLPPEIRNVAGELEADGSFDTTAAVVRLIKHAGEAVRNEIKGNIGLIVSEISIGLCAAFALTFCGDGTNKYYVNLIGVCAEAVLLLGSMDALINSIAETMRRLSDYSKVAFPAVFTASAISGAAISAPAKYAVVCLGLEVLMNLSDKLIIPLVYAFAALSLSGCVYGNAMTDMLKKTSKWAAITLMTALTLTFSLLLSVSGAITGSADALAVKTARTVISGTLPVVGGLASDAAAAVLSAASMIKASVGALGMTAVCAFCIEPFAKLFVRYLAFKAGAAVCTAFSGGCIGSFLDDMGSTAAMLMGLPGSECIMLFISFTSAIKAVTGV